MNKKVIQFNKNNLPISKRKHRIVKYFDEDSNELLHNKEFYKDYNNEAFRDTISRLSMLYPNRYEGCELILYNDDDEVTFDEWIYIEKIGTKWKFIDSYEHELVF